ncbi:hypothetical protein KGF57_004789 [Candida theae]|uniref:Transcription factor CBF/NF-Y/archaeal histone domain-containing protein n=1 Tax=Candida theae TaxID=1198502 RepID=A0AAD5BAZ5_9ASCO|nr:uncharacterized protein KGF57_004789 [Candida theae]KAI5949191.1 hypothetical protein KGF57_004789 [Candida theae]
MSNVFNESPIDKDWNNSDYEIKEQDRFLPIANVGRVMKKALPERAKLSKESKECVQECVSEFISFITSQAADKCKLEKRKTLNGEDLLWAMYTLGFENYSETLKIYLAKYRSYEQQHASIKPPRRKVHKKKTKSEKQSLVEEETEDEYNAEFDQDFGNNTLNAAKYFQENNLTESSYSVPVAATSGVASSFPLPNDYFPGQGIEDTGAASLQYLTQQDIQQEQLPLFPQAYTQSQPGAQALHTQSRSGQLYTPQEQAYNMGGVSDVQKQLNQEGQGVGIVLRSSVPQANARHRHR